MREYNPDWLFSENGLEEITDWIEENKKECERIEAEERKERKTIIYTADYKMILKRLNIGNLDIECVSLQDKENKRIDLNKGFKQVSLALGIHKAKRIDDDYEELAYFEYRGYFFTGNPNKDTDKEITKEMIDNFINSIPAK